MAFGVLGAVEVALRLVLGPPPSAVAVFAALGPHERYLDLTEDTVTVGYGRRRPPPFPRRSAAPRVVVLGGSSVHEGTPRLPAAEEFPGLLAAALSVEVLNLGSPGLDSHDLVRIVDELDAVEVSTVVVYTGHNDFGNTYFAERYGSVGSALGARVLGRLSQLQLYAQLSRMVVAPTGTDRSRGGAGPPGRGAPAGLTAEQVRRTLDALRRNLERIAWRTGRQGRALVLVPPVSRLTTLPWEGECAPGSCPSDQMATATDLAASDPAAAVALLQRLRDEDRLTLRAHTAAQDTVRAVAARHDHVVLVDAFAQLPRDPVFAAPHRHLFIDPVHLAPEGHAAMARILEGPVAATLAGGPAR